MRALVCEMCGSQDIVKQQGLYVCQCCGTKYSVEEARNLMMEGTVKIDRSGELKNLYQAARNAREAGDSESAIRHYEQISALDPNSWEAVFYLVILRLDNIKNGQIESGATSVSNCLLTVFGLIYDHVVDEKDKKAAVLEVIEQCNTVAGWLTTASHSFYKSLTSGDGLIALTGIFGAISSLNSVSKELGEHTNRCEQIANIMFNCGTLIENMFDMDDEDYRSYAVWAWQKCYDLHCEFGRIHKIVSLLDEEDVHLLNQNIIKYSKKADSGRQNKEEPIIELTIEYNANLGGASVLFFRIDDSQQYKLRCRKSETFRLKRGIHTLILENPSVKEHVFNLQEPQVISIYGKTFGMEID